MNFPDALTAAFAGALIARLSWRDDRMVFAVIDRAGTVLDVRIEKDRINHPYSIAPAEMIATDWYTVQEPLPGFRNPREYLPASDYKNRRRRDLP